MKKTRKITIAFNQYQLPVLITIASERQACKTAASNQRYCESSDFSIGLQGVMGEAAVAAELGLKVDRKPSITGDDKITDLQFGDTRIQVKCRKPHTKFLYFNTLEKFAAEIGVATSLSGASEVDIIGWITRQEFRDKHILKDFGYGQRVAVPDADLQPPDTLLAHLKQLNP